jgi:MFS family permease
LLSFAIFGAVSNFAAAAVEATLVLFAIQALHLGDAGFGLLLAAASIGGVAASLTADRTLNRFGPGTVYIVGSAAAGAAMLVAAATSNGAVCAALFAIVFAAIAYGDVLAYSLRAELVPDHLRGRVNSIYRTMLWVAWPLGALVGGLLVTTVGVRVPIALFGIASFAIAGAASAFANNRTIAHARQLAPVEVDLTQPDDDHLSSAQGAAAEAIAERPTQIF